MTLILETGGSIRDGNSYASAAYSLSYLTARNRQAENNWNGLTTPVQEAHLIAATQYIDTRWGHRFKGSRRVYYNGAKAVGRLVFSGQPSADENVVVGDYTYVFKSALSSGPVSAFEVLIGASAAVTATNLYNAIVANGETTTYSDNTEANQSATAANETSAQVDLEALMDGTSGNEITLTTTSGNITVTTFVNGLDYGSQPLEFPRSGLYDQDGVAVQGIPRALKDATVEYAVRNAANTLYSDPTVDPSGRLLKSKKIGPLEWEWEDGTSLSVLIKPYPAADRLLRDYLLPEGRVYR